MDITIKTKFDIGQEVYWMSNTRIHKGTIKGLQVCGVELTEEGLNRDLLVIYSITGGYCHTDSELFSSQEEIIADLITKSEL